LYAFVISPNVIRTVKPKFLYTIHASSSFDLKFKTANIYLSLCRVNVVIQITYFAKVVKIARYDEIRYLATKATEHCNLYQDAVWADTNQHQIHVDLSIPNLIEIQSVV
jgi:hypothetical protein